MIRPEATLPPDRNAPSPNGLVSAHVRRSREPDAIVRTHASAATEGAIACLIAEPCRAAGLGRARFVAAEVPRPVVVPAARGRASTALLGGPQHPAREPSLPAVEASTAVLLGPQHALATVGTACTTGHAAAWRRP